MIIKLDFTKIDALAKPGLEMFTNSFSYHDDDYFHKNIGSLFGVMQVGDHSKNSEYLPNLLTSILKKSFYSDTHKTAEQNFELALKKINLALADLAEHDITEWNNNLHALVGIIHNNKLFFTQVGSALILIGRNNKIMHLSEPGSAITHPIKTFQDIITGEIQKKDKIIIATPTLFNIFTPKDIDRLFKTFSSKEFDDIFSKTIQKEGVNVSTVIINIKTKKESDYSKKAYLNNEDLSTKELTKEKNFLGEEIKDNNTNNKPSTQTKKGDATKGRKSTPKKIKQPLSKKQALDIAQKKVKPNKPKSLKKRKKAISTPNSKLLTEPNTKDVQSSPTKIKKISSATQKTITTIKPPKKRIPKLNDLKDIESKKLSSDSKPPFEELKEIYIKDDKLIEQSKKPSSKKLKKFFHRTNSNKKNNTIIAQKKKALKSIDIISSTPSIKTGNPKINEQGKVTNRKSTYSRKKVSHSFLDKQRFSIDSARKKIINSFFKLLKSTQWIKKITPQKIFGFLLRLSSFFRRALWKISSYLKPFLSPVTPLIKKYRIALLMLLLIIIIPIVIMITTKSRHNKETMEKLKLPATPIADKVQSTIANKNQTRKILSLPSTIKLIAANDSILIAYTKTNQLYKIDKKTNKAEKLLIPNSIKLQDLKSINYIASLNLFFLSSDKKIISYSPKINKFIKNTITLPSKFQLAGQDTYLSYLYLLDRNSKQIYRYPRATGGFGAGKQWLKKPLNYNAKISAMTIDEYIRVAYLDGTVEKYSRGKLVSTKNFKLKSLDLIKTGENLKSYYLLSKQDGKILKINKDNDSIEKEYQNSAIQTTETFTVNEKNKLLYIFNDKELLSIDL